MRTSRRIVTTFVFSVLIFWGCSPLRKWVRQRGYEFNEDYSTTNVIGYEVEVKGHLMANPYFAVDASTQGYIPDEQKDGNTSLDMGASADLAQLVKAMIPGANLVAGLSLAHSSTLKLTKPYNQGILAYYPTSPCPPEPIKVARKVLNTGEMKLTVTDKHGANITGSFQPVVPTAGALASTAASGNFNANLASTDTISGNGFFVGYEPGVMTCRSTTLKDVPLKTGVQVRDNEVGMYAELFETRPGDMPNSTEALVMIVPSALIGPPLAKVQMDMGEMELADSRGYMVAAAPVGGVIGGVMSGSAGGGSLGSMGSPGPSSAGVKSSSHSHAKKAKKKKAKNPSSSSGSTYAAKAIFTTSPWDLAVSAEDLKKDPTSLKTKKNIKVKFGDGFGVPLGGVPSGLYVEVSKVSDDEATLTVKRLDYKFAKRTENSTASQ